MPRSPAAELIPLVKLLAEDRRYKIEAYQFVGAGLEHAQESLGYGKPAPHKRKGGSSDGRKSDKRISDKRVAPKRVAEETRPIRHISGQELCLALKHLAHQQYGRLAKLVLASWGIHATSDFGEIVYNLIRIGKMSKSEDDRRDDFNDVFDFEQALVRDFSITSEEESCRP